MRYAIVIALTAVLTAVPGDARSADQTPQRRVLVLAVDDLTRPYVTLIVNRFAEVVLADSSSPALYFESMDASRFGSGSYFDGLRDWYRRKYADTRIDFVVALGEPAVELLARERLWTDIPLLYVDVGQVRVDTGTLLPRAGGALLAPHFKDALGVIKQILPGTRHVALVYGASEVERTRWNAYAQMVRDTNLGLEPIELTGIPNDQLPTRLNALPTDAVVMMLSPNVDARGQVLTPGPPCPLVETSINRPVFTLALQDLGCGVVGGLQRDWEKVGGILGRRTLTLLQAPSTDVITIPVADYTTLAFDARQLDRWKISESALPPGSDVRFRQPSLWREHRPEVIGALLIGLLQTSVIAALLVEHRRRRRAELQARQHLVAMAHLDRRAAMGELATSLAHEVNQPLNAILQNAGAARMIVDAQPTRHPDELREILDEIRKDDLRASEVIRRMRKLLQKHELEARPVNLKDLASETVALVAPDARSRNVDLQLDLRDSLQPALGDRVHLQQVLLNLLLNAMDAVAPGAHGQRRVLVQAVARNGQAGLAVHDTGPGIARDRLARVFEPFFTTKGDGMGLGLAVARQIIEAHGGRIAAENNDRPPGATVWFTVPLAEEHAS